MVVFEMICKGHATGTPLKSAYAGPLRVRNSIELTGCREGCYDGVGKPSNHGPPLMRKRVPQHVLSMRCLLISSLPAIFPSAFFSLIALLLSRALSISLSALFSTRPPRHPPAISFPRAGTPLLRNPRSPKIWSYLFTRLPKVMRSSSSATFDNIQNHRN